MFTLLYMVVRLLMLLAMLHVAHSMMVGIGMTAKARMVSWMAIAVVIVLGGGFW